MTSKFKDGTGGCAGKSPSPEFPGCGGLSGFSPTIFFIQMIYHLKYYY